MDNKPFWQSKKFWVSIAGVLASIIPLVMGMLPPNSEFVAVLGAVAAAISYVTAQGKVDAAKALSAAPSVPPANPPQP